MKSNVVVDLDLDNLFENTALSILEYCSKIKKANTDADEGSVDIIMLSELYSKVSNLSSYQEVLQSFAEYFLLFYPQLYFYVKSEKYECADIIKSAMKKEIEFILNFVLQNFQGLKSDVKALNDKFKEYYLK